jgi:cytochrome P450
MGRGFRKETPVVNVASDVYFDPFDLGIRARPYAVYGRLRDEAPLFYNATHDFFVVSRFDDVERLLTDRDSFISSKGGVLDVLKSGIEMPPGMFIFEDPPLHTKHRGLVSRIFTPKSMSAIEPQIRAYCASTLDRLVGRDGFDFVRDIGAEVPMRVIGMLLGIPESDQVALRDRLEESMQGTYDESRIDEPLQGLNQSFEAFGEYVDWRADHPSDDLMTMMLTIEFEDHTGMIRRLTRDEILTYVILIAAAGNDTTNRLIGWTGKVLSDHPDACRQLVEDPSLVPNAIEEILRFEPRLEGRVVLDEVLKRFPTWQVDEDRARLTDDFLTRGWEALPVSV